MLTVLRQYDPQQWVHELRCATGRSALWHLLQRMQFTGVLLPCYVPEGIIEPVKGSGLPWEFYRLDNHLHPFDLHERIKGRVGWLVIIIDYFGISHECRSLGPNFQLRDCAHDLWADPPWCDFALWSINKILPVVDGAVLRSRFEFVDISVDERTLEPIPEEADCAYRFHLEWNGLLRFVQSGFSDPNVKGGGRWYERYYEIVRDYRKMWRQSWESRFAEQKMLVSHSYARIVHAELLDKLIPAQFKLSERYPVFAYPVLCPPGQRDVIMDEMMAAGVLPTICGDKWDHIPRDGRFAAELDFFNRHLLLPMHEGIGEGDIKRMANVLTKRMEKSA